MEKRSVEAIVGALNHANVRYLVVGGLAVVAHGYVRFTADIDLILDLDAANVSQAIAAMTAFSLFSADHPATELDLFVEPPLDFEAAYHSAVRMEVAPGVIATFIGLADLLSLKQRAGRAQDLLDIEKLTALRQERKP